MCLVQEETLVVFYTRMPLGDRETMRKEVEDARRSRLEQASSSAPKVKTQTDVKKSNSLEARLATKAENSLSMGGKM